jgi:hypothetical protein
MKRRILKAGVRSQEPGARSQNIRLRAALTEFSFLLFWLLTPGFWILFSFIPHPSALIPYFVALLAK